MTNETRMSLIDAGWEFGDAEDFLELTPEERRYIEREERIARLKARAEEILLEHFIRQQAPELYDETPCLTLSRDPEWNQ